MWTAASNGETRTWAGMLRNLTLLQGWLGMAGRRRAGALDEQSKNSFETLNPPKNPQLERHPQLERLHFYGFAGQSSIQPSSAGDWDIRDPPE
jgi:hypothetical protein